MKILFGMVLILVLTAGCAGLGAVGSHGAVAYAPSTQDWRLRWRVVDPQRVRQVVLEDCPAADCRVVLEFGPGQCGTLALGQQAGFGVGLGDTPAAAEAAALAECQRTGADCRVASAECNS
ncbi:MAG: DUF4189 domain-containing protein [Candidatus Contendobacter sp.]|nr:DUF4189 domain-containing protein [Candidatus Contendobacter sp.]